MLRKYHSIPIFKTVLTSTEMHSLASIRMIIWFPLSRLSIRCAACVVLSFPRLAGEASVAMAFLSLNVLLSAVGWGCTLK